MWITFCNSQFFPLQTHFVHAGISHKMKLMTLEFIYKGHRGMHLIERNKHISGLAEPKYKGTEENED
jgi:hypothetical protein